VRTVHFVLASVEIKDVLAQWQTVSVATREVLIVTGAVVLVTVGILVCVAFLRKSGRRHHRHHHRYHDVQKPAQDTPAAEDGGDPSQPQKRRKWRRLRRPHRPRNPTLAETGGLPPIRQENPPEAEL